MAKLNRYNYDNIKRILYFAKIEDLEEVLEMKKNLRVTHQNIISNNKIIGIKTLPVDRKTAEGKKS